MSEPLRGKKPLTPKACVACGEVVPFRLTATPTHNRCRRGRSQGRRGTTPGWARGGAA